MCHDSDRRTDGSSILGVYSAALFSSVQLRLVCLIVLEKICSNLVQAEIKPDMKEREKK